MDIGFIGLGAMGKGMAANLIKAGHTVRVWNRTRSAVDALVEQGAVAADRPDDAARGEAVLSALADDAAVREVFLGSDLLDRMGGTTVHVNTATISLAFAGELADRHRRAGVPYVSAPVFGRSDVAAAGKLHVLAAGDGDAIARVQPLLDAIGQKTWPLGSEPTRASVVKLAGNFMLASAIEATAEAVALGRANGVEAAELLDVLTGTLFNVPAYRNYGALISEGRYEPPAFRLRLGLKDVRLALAAGEEKGVAMPFGEVLRELHAEAVEDGYGDKDWAALAEVVRRRSGQAGSG